MSKDNVIRLDRRQPYEARPMREDALPPHQERPFLRGLWDEARRDTNWIESQLAADPAWLDLSLDALLGRARLRRAVQQLAGIDDRTIARSRTPSGKGRSPFRLPEFPPNVVPSRDSGARMAMDDAGGWAEGQWGLFGIVASTFAEGMAFPGYSVLAELAQRPEYRKFAEIIANEMTRKWIKITSTKEDVDEDDPEVKKKHETNTEKIAKIDADLKRLRAQDAFRRCVEIDEFFGRSHLYVDTGQTENREELKLSIGDGRDEISRAKFGKGDLKALRAIEPVWVYPTSYTANDPLRDDWYNPQTWFVLGKEVHKSRLLRFVGREVPDLLKPAYSFGGLSMTQMARAYVDNWLRTRQSVSDIIHAYSVFVLKTNLGASLTDGGDQLFRRAELFNNLRDNRGVMMLDKETEDFQNVSANIGGLEGLQAQSQEQMCSVASIPVVKFLGIQPSGLNASDEGGIRVFYDWIASQQEKRMRPQLTTIIDFVQLSLFGEVDPTITFTFEPLREMDESEEADLREKEARTDISYIDSGVLSQHEVRKKVASDPDSPYASIDVDEEPNLPQEEAEGLDPKAGQKNLGGKPPKPPGGGEPEGGGGGGPASPSGGAEQETKDAEPAALSAWEQRLKDHDERHERRDTEFHRRAAERDKRIRADIEDLFTQIKKRLDSGASLEDQVDTTTEDSAGFKESDHPRGQPSNSGQFASAPGGGSESGGGSKKSLSDKQKNSVRTFIGDDPYKNSVGINGALREKKSLTSEQQSVVDDVDAAIRSAPPLARETTMYRGVEKDWSRGQPDPAFTSMSTRRDVADEFATATSENDEGFVYEISVPAGTRALNTKDLQDSGMAYQDEYLFPRGGRLVPTGRRQKRGDVTVVSMRYEGPEGSGGGSGGGLKKQSGSGEGASQEDRRRGYDLLGQSKSEKNRRKRHAMIREGNRLLGRPENEGLDSAVRESGEFSGYRDGPSEIPPEQLQGVQAGGGQPPSTLSEDEFEEKDHPRDDGGKFTEGAGGGGAKTKVKGTTKERVERLAASYRHAMERAQKSGDQAKVDKFKSRLQKLGAAHDEIGGTSTRSAHVEALKKAALDVARRRGFRDLSRIKITDEVKKFMVNGQECLYAGSYNNYSGEIHLYANDQVTVASVPGIIAHEVMHDKWNFVRSGYSKRFYELREKAEQAVEDGVRPNPWLKPDGSLGPEAKKSKKYAIYDAMHSAFYSVRPEELSKTDGVTPYSREWWNAYAKGNSSLDNAVNETLAEMSMELHVNGKLPRQWAHRYLAYKEIHEPAKNVSYKDEEKSHRTWEKLFQTVEKLYEKHAPHVGFEL